MLLELISLLVTLIIVDDVISNYFSQNNKNTTVKNIPPGPWGFPILGHLPLLGKNMSLTFLKWSKFYGPIFSIKFASYPTVIPNDGKIIKEAWAMEEFSGRPRFKLFAQVSNHKGINWTDGPRMFEQRKFAKKTMKELGIGARSQFHLDKEISKFLNNLKEQCRAKNDKNQESFIITPIESFFRYPVINCIWEGITGQRFSEDDPTLNLFLSTFDNFVHTSKSTATLLTWFFPQLTSILKFFGYNPDGVVKDFHAIYEHCGKEIEMQRKTYVPGEPQNFTHAFFDKVAKTTDTESSFHVSRNEQPISTGDILTGALDNLTVALDWVLLFMAREPEVQKKMQAEIDLVCGNKLLSTTTTETDKDYSFSKVSLLSDRTKMPYTEAVFQECLRMSSITPFGMFHRATVDIPDFHGYRIPKDTLVLANLLGVQHDPSVWQEPQKFRPERFLEESLDKETNRIEPKKSSDNFLPFGCGKRGCIGESFARDNMFLIATRFFQKFTVSYNTKEDREIPALDVKFGFVLHPRPFSLKLTERL